MMIKNLTNGKVLATNAWECRTLIERCRGLMFKRIKKEQGCVLISDDDGIINSSIHMMFVPQDLHVIWVNDDYRVVSVKKCRRGGLNPLTWRAHFPDKPARYVIELLDAQGTLKGDRIQFIK